MFKPLLRTMPSLNGNIKLACYINDYNNLGENVYEGNVRSAMLSPLSSHLYNKYLNISLLSSSYEWDVREFYKKYSNYFYKKIFDVNQEELPLYNEIGINKNRNTDFEFGVKRISYIKSGKQFAFFAPIFLEGIDDVPDYFEINIEIKNTVYSTNRTIRINIKNNLDSQKNYLGRYIIDYASKLDNNVVYLSKDENKAIYYGIDVNSGGFSSKHDVVISSIFEKQNTILNFDNKINKGFERNRMIMKQVIPLSFYFSLNDVLSNIEKEVFYGSELNISGKWVKDNLDVSLYDYSTNYSEYSPFIYNLDMIDGTLKTIVPKQLNQNNEYVKINLMNINYPSLKESSFYKYRYSNKITPNFNRWKLRYSEDEFPYIINLSSAFSLYQQSRTKYHMFPANHGNIPGVIIKKPYYLDLCFPLNGGEEKYATNVLKKYVSMRNNFCSSWFEIFDDKFEYFVDVDNNKAFFNGILYNLQNIYDSTKKDSLQQITKFGVFVNPIINCIKDSDLSTKYIYSDYLIIKEHSKYISKPNCHVNDNVLTGDNPRIFDNLNTKVRQDELSRNRIFVKNYEGTGDFISLKDFGVSWYEINDFINVKELENKIPQNIYDCIKDKSSEGYDVVPVYRLSNIMDNDRLNETILNYDELYVSDFGSQSKIMLSDNILSSLDLKNKYSIYNKIFYRKNNFLDRNIALTELDTSYYEHLKRTRPNKSYIWYSNEVKDFVNTYSIYINDATSYQYNPVLSTSAGVNYAFNSFTETDKTINKHFYGSNITEPELKDDNNFIWVDPYNINKIINHYNNSWLKDSKDKLKVYNSINGETFYCKFLNNLHFRFYHRCLYRNINDQAIGSSWNNIYIRKRYFTDDLSVKDGYVSLKNVIFTGAKDAEIFELIGFDEETNLFYFKHLNYDPFAPNNAYNKNENTGLWYFNDDKKLRFGCYVVDSSIFGNPEDYATFEEIDGVTTKRYDFTRFKFELVFAKQMIRMDENIMRLMNLEEKYEAPYKDLYLYEIESDQEFNQYLPIKNLINTADGCNMHSPLSGTAPRRGVLRPLFNLATIQNKEETLIFTEYSINSVNKTKVSTNSLIKDIYYRHNMNDVVLMYDLSTINKNEPVTIKKKNYFYNDYLYNYAKKFIDRTSYETNLEYEQGLKDIIKSKDLRTFTNTYDLFTSNEINFRNHSVNPQYLEETVIEEFDKEVERVYIYEEDEFKLKFAKDYTYMNSWINEKEGEWTYNNITKHAIPPNPSYYSVITYLQTKVVEERTVYREKYQEYDDLGLYKDYNICTYSYNNDIYGFYLLDVNLNNTTNTFNVETENGEYVKYLSYINDINISDHPEFIKDIYKQAVPFIKNNPLNFMLKNSYLMMKPKYLKFNCYYHPIKKNNKYYDIVFDKSNYDIVTLERYFEHITPLIEPAHSLMTYNLKYKDMDKSFNNYYTDETIYPLNTSLYGYPGVRVYNMNNMNDYEIKFDNEWKHFNNNKMFNLEESFTYSFEYPMKKKEVIFYQTTKKTFDIFKDHILEYDNSFLTEDKIEWAFSKYDVKYSSEPVELDYDGEKLYSLDIHFILF